MIINLWSTPRSGSVWYSRYLQSQYPDSVRINELLNQYQIGVYHMFTEDRFLNSYNYSVGYYYHEYFMDNGTIGSNKVFAPRERSVAEEEIYRIQLINQIDPANTLILHNHVAPINEKIRQQLIDSAYKNIYIYRKDKRAQLASYAIAYASKQWVQLVDYEDTGIITELDITSLKNLISRIKFWDQLTKQDSIAYEEIKFFDQPNWPKKQNKDYKLRLSDDIIKIIDQLVTEYENQVTMP